MTPTYRKSFLIALTGHVALIIAVIVASLLPGCRRKIKLDTTVDVMLVTPKNEPLMRQKPAPEHPVPPPPGTPDQPRTPDMPPEPLPVRPPEPEPVKHPETLPTPKPPEIKPVHTNAEPHAVVSEKHEIKIGPHVVRPTTGVTSHKAPTKLSKAEWDRMMGVSAPLGDRDSLPMDEKQRCLLLIKQALYDAWDQPGVADAGARPAELEIRFDLSGRVVDYRITRSSGSEIFDRSVTQAAAAVPRVEELTTRFLRDYARLTIEFKLTE